MDFESYVKNEMPDHGDMGYYSYRNIFNRKDLDNKYPSIYMISTNRSAGKTTSALEISLDLYRRYGLQTCLLYRYGYELSACGSIYTDVLSLYPQYGEEMTTKAMANGLFYQMVLDGEVFGYAVALNKPDQLKKYSPLFTKCYLCIFDEYQLETGQYLPDEFGKLQSIIFTIARGGGEQSRELKILMLGNNVSLMNPYFIKYSIHKRLMNDTKFLRGHGWIAEFGFNESSSKAIQENPLYKAFADADTTYTEYATQSVYLYDTKQFIESYSGRSIYLFTIKYDGKFYGVRDCSDGGFIYISKKPDMNYPTIITFNANDHDQITMLINRKDYLWKNIRDAFNKGYLRFDDAETKNMIFEILGIDLYK